MPSVGDEVSRQTQRAVAVATKDAKTAVTAMVFASVSIPEKATSGLRPITVKTVYHDGKPAAYQQVYVHIRSRSSAPTLTVDLTLPSPGVEYFTMTPSGIQLDEGFTSTPSVNAFLCRTDASGQAVFNLTCAAGDDVVIRVTPLGGQKEARVVWTA